MKKMYLTPTLPETTLGKLPIDVKRRLAEYVAGKDMMTNIPPHIRPQALVKYDTNKIPTIKEEEEAPTMEETVQPEDDMFEHIPEKYMKKAKKLLQLIGQRPLQAGLEMPLVLRDLIVPTGPIRSPLPLLQDLLEQLGPLLPERMITAVIRARIAGGPPRRKLKQGRRKGIQPRSVSHAQSASSHATPLRGELNTWKYQINDDVSTKPSWNS